MNRQPYKKPPRWWSPKPSKFWVRFWQRSRKRMQIERHRVVAIDVHGLEPLRQKIDEGWGVLITPNHASHADCFAIYEIADQLRIPFYVMIAWQNFVRDGAFRTMVLRQHGGFSVNREGNDLTAFRQAVDVLQTADYPLVVFPEGDVFHINDRILPFREGPAAMALSAARRGDRPVCIVPCAIKYRYRDDPTPELTDTMRRLEEAIHWRPRADLTLPERIYRLAEGALSLKEIEYFGTTRSGPYPARIEALIELILSRLAGRYTIPEGCDTVPDRVKVLRQQVIQRMTGTPAASQERTECEEELAELFFAVQLLSYPGDYVAEDPTIERIAETIDKLEEDVLGAKTATIRGTRQATVTLGEPIPVANGKSAQKSPTELTRVLEARLQRSLNGQLPAWHTDRQGADPPAMAHPASPLNPVVGRTTG